MAVKSTLIKGFFLLAALFVLFSISYNNFLDSDTWWHMSSGREIIKAHGLPKYDTFSYAANQKWYSHEWLFDVIIYLLSIFIGINNLLYFKILMAAGLFGLLFLVIRVRQQAKYLEPVLPFWLLAVYLLSPFLVLRPQFFTFLFILYFIYVLEHEPVKSHKILYYSLPVAAVLWVNIHATEIIGAIVMFIYCVFYSVNLYKLKEKRQSYDFRILLISLAGVILASFISPEGPKSLIFFMQDFGIKQYIKEWQTGFDFSNIDNAAYFSVFFIYSATVILVFFRNLKDSDIRRNAVFLKDGVIILLFLTAGLAVRKNIPLFIITSLPILSYYIFLAIKKDVLLTENKDLVTFNNKIYIAVTLLLLAFGAFKIAAVPKSIYPEQALKYITKSKVPPNLFSNYEWGGYFEYMLFPEYKIMVNGRLNALFTVIQEYSNIYYTQGNYKDFIAKNNINSFLLSYGAPVIDKLSGLNYKAVYFDDEAIIFVNPQKIDKYFKYLTPADDSEFYTKANFKKAFSELKDFTTDYPSEKACLMLAIMYLDKNREQAIEYLNRIITAHGNYSALYNLLGNIYYDMGEYKKAVDIWTRSEKKTAEIKTLLNAAKNNSKPE